MKKYTLKMTLETQSHCAGELILFKPQEKFLQLVEQQLYSSSVILCFYVMLRTGTHFNWISFHRSKFLRGNYKRVLLSETLKDSFEELPEAIEDSESSQFTASYVS